MEAFPTMENAEITVRTVHLVPAPNPSDLRSQRIRFAFFFLSLDDCFCVRIFSHSFVHPVDRPHPIRCVRLYFNDRQVA
jgi:hypothetical protein